MGKSVSKPTGSKGIETPLDPVELLTQYGAKSSPYGNVNVQETLKQTSFNPSDYEYVDNPSSLDIGTERVSGVRQPISDIVGRSLKQFGANVLGAIATSAANTADVKSTFDILADKETEFNSELFGVSTNDIMSWTREVAEKNKIYQDNPGSFNPSDVGWWGDQIASTGTGVGMALYALGETALVGLATEGTGVIPELINNIRKIPSGLRMIRAAKTVEEAAKMADTLSKLKRTATTYAIMNRLNESKMESQQTFQESYQELLNEKNPDGTNKYSEEQAREAAASGARRDFLWNMPLMALDILTYRTMVFNPIGGGGTNLIEKGLAKIGNKALRTTAQFGVGSVLEGAEEGLQYIGAEEGKHYARVLSGMDDGSTFLERVGKNVSSDQFWNNFAGGVIGSPVIGGVMKLFNTAMNGKSQRRLSQMHNDFVSNIGKMDDHISQTIREYEGAGNTETAEVLRRNFGAMKAMSSLYLDAMKNTDTAFDSYKNFLKQTLEEVSAGKTDSLQDLGFTNPTPQQLEQVKNNFSTYLQDADRMQRIFNQVASQHEKQFVPEIAYQMFSVETRRQKQGELDAKVAESQDKVFGYSSLSPMGKELHDIEYRMLATKNEVTRLRDLKKQAKNRLEQQNIDAVIKVNEESLKGLNDRLSAINKEESYTTQQRDADAGIISTPVRDNEYYKNIRDSIANTSQIDLENRNLSLWNKEEYKNEQSTLGILKSRNKEQLEILEKDLTAKGKMTDSLRDAIDERKKFLSAREAVEEQKNKKKDAANPAPINPQESSAPITPTQVQPTNVSVMPEASTEAAPTIATKPIAEDSDLFGDAMNSIMAVVAEQGVTTSNPILSNVDKVNIVNIEEVIEDNAGRLAVELGEETLQFKSFDLHVNPNENRAYIISLRRGKNVTQDNILSIIIKLGQELQQRGILLQGLKESVTEIESAWKSLIDMQYAKKNNDGTFSFLGQPVEAEVSYSGPVEVSLAPAEINDNLNEDQKTRLKDAVAVLLQNKTNPTFEELVRAAINQSNLETADRTFNLLVRGWELNGYSPVDYRQTYTRVFQDPIGTLNSLLGELAKVNEPNQEQKPKQVEQSTKGAIEDTINNQNEPTNFNNVNQPIYNYTGFITSESSKKFAFLSAPYVLSLTTQPDGSTTVDKTTVGGELNQGDYIDSLKLLDPNKYTEGTPMQVAIPSNFLDIKVSTTNPDGTPGDAMPFGQYVAEKGLNLEDAEYRDKLPMIIYDKGRTDKGVAFVHDVQWYNPINFNQDKPGEMEEAIRATREMRDAVIAAKGRPVGITITSKRETTFEGLKLPENTFISLNQANPQSTITVARSINQLTVDGKNVVFEGELMNTKPFSENMAYDVRQTGRRDGKPVYTAFPLGQPQMSDLNKSSVIMALKVFVNAKNTNLLPGDKAIFDNIHAQILATSGIDIRSVNGINQYLSQFIYIANLENANSVADAESQLKGRGKKEGYKYITINSSGGITFGTVGKPMAPKSNGFFVNPNPGKDPAKSFQLANSFLDNLTKTDFLKGYQQHVHFGSLNKNKPVAQVSMKGEPTVVPSYKEYLMNTLTTNIRSLNIGTAQDPNYVTNVQPIITYELDSNLNKYTEPETIEEIKREVIPEVSTVDTRIEELVRHGETGNNIEGIRRLQRELINQAKQELGLDFLNELEENLSPLELTEEQREIIGDSVQSIAGLNPQQQSELVDFMYNQVVAMIDIDNKEGVSREQVYAEVKRSFEAIIKPLRKIYLDKVKQIQDIIQLDPESPNLQDLKLAEASYQRGIIRINDIQANYKLMENETQLKVEKYTNIHKGKLAENIEEDPDVEEDEDAPFDEGDGSVERTKEFAIDSLTENPDNKLTYAMRRFLGQIRRIDKQGNPAKGFLGLPVYVGSDTVASTVRDLLADVPSDYNVMMSKLEQSLPAHPWLRELIDRLQGSTRERKNQFVTVFSNHRLSMKFSMIAYDNRTKTWNSKVFNTFQSGLANQLALSWYSNFIDSSLVTMVNEVYTLNIDEAKKMVDEYDSWIGGAVSSVQSPITDILPIVKQVSSKKPSLTINPTGALLTELQALKSDERVRFKYRNIDYQIIKSDNTYQVSLFNKSQTVSPDGVRIWLSKLGIQMSDNGFNELMTNGLYHNFERVKGDALFSNANGLFRILATAIRTGMNSPNKDLVTGDGNPLNQSVIKSLTNLESNFNTSVNSPNGRDNGKSIFGFTAPKFITDRTRDLKVKEGEVIQQLSTISFSKKSLWLDLFVNSEKFREQFEVSHIGLTALKEMGKKVYKDNGITKLSDVDHELTKLIMFWDTRQGDVNYNNQINTFSDTTIPMRMATVFVPTMSDKSNMMLLKTAVLNLEEKHFTTSTDNQPKAGKEILKGIYEQAVRPELLRMIKHAQIGGKTNIAGYDAGAKMFLLIPQLNYIKYNEDLLLIDAVTNGVEEFNLEFIENNQEIMDKIYETLDQTLSSLVSDKVSKWIESDLVNTDNKGNITGFEFMDRKYSDKFNGTPREKTIKAAIDFEANSMIANANSFMMYAGDPAIYYKSSSNDYIQKAKDTFVNVGKRLANQIAPGTAVANSEEEQYLQVFLGDRKSLPEIPFLKYVTRILDGREITDKEIAEFNAGDKNVKSSIVKNFPKSSGYFSIEGSDAQEYTTWREHLSLLEKLGKTSDGIFEITPEEIQEARELFASGGKKALTPKQEKLLSKVLQPMKPVYTGQIYDKDQDVMRTVYIKSSSFPLIPQLTAGLEIDKLRTAMETLEKKAGKNVRASYQTANKVGSLTNISPLWNTEGTIDQSVLDNIQASSLILDRKNFRIQQDVPYKSGKRLEDKVTLGTQLMKILFGNGIIDANGFILDGTKYTGRELHTIYNDSFDQLIKIKRSQLFDELGLDENGIPIDAKRSIEKLQKILKQEALTRGYPIQDIEGLSLDANGNFITPLWSSANSNRYEAMLNAIVTNRLIKIKFPGNSYVVGSEEGFRFQENFEGVDQSKIVWTSKWTGKLEASYNQDGTLNKAQVLVASKFRDNKGEMIDLLAKKDGKYIYVTQSETGSFMLNEEMFPEDLRSLTSFRIPTSGHLSAAQVEIAGFLPAQSADLMIVPRNFTKQMGLDFDIDKQNTYQLWHYQDEETGKFMVLDETLKDKILNSTKGDLKDGTAAGKLMAAIFGEDLPSFTEEEIKSDAQLRALDAKLQEKILQNKIIKIHSSVLTNPDDKIQSKINGILSTDYAEEQADLIDGLINKETTNKVFTPLSSEYQKMKMSLGAAGKIGTGAYSLDVVFHSLMQQAKSLGRGLYITEPVVDEEGNMEVIDKTFRFGNQASDGKLGKERTIDGERSISEVLAELQNIALDNEKLQVMGRIGLNDLTIDVSKVFALLGFDKGNDKGKSSVQFTFLSQPIIREFIAMSKNASSNMAEFSQDKEQTVILELLKKHSGNEVWDRLKTDKNYKEDMAYRMSTQEMLIALQTENPDGELQVAILDRFIEMRAYGVQIRSIQTGINTDSKGLGKSFFDVIAKKEALNKLGHSSLYLQNADRLIGDYKPNKREANYSAEGYTNIGEFWVKPNSLTGSFNVYAVSAAYNLWSKHLPYDTETINYIYNEVMSNINMGQSTTLIDNKAVLIKQEVFKSFKKYLSTNPENGIIANEDRINAERQRLYIDSEANTSLAKYVKSLRDATGNKIIDNYIKTNKLINRFEFDIQKNGTPSLIKFNNAVGEEFDEQYLYNSLGYLLSSNKSLPDYNGKPYDTTKLAQDLIAYTYLGNATQEAIQFTKYIPVTYNNIVGYSQFMREAGERLTNDLGIVGGKLKTDETQGVTFPSDLTIQFLQHNPERVKVKIAAKDLSKSIHTANPEYKGNLTNLESFSLVLEEGVSAPTFISIYNKAIPKGEKKFQLYINQGDGVFKKIPVLGTFGMDEYNATVSVNDSLVNAKPKAVVTPSSNVKTASSNANGDRFGINSGNVATVLQNISKLNLQGLSDLARELAPYSSNLNIKYADMVSDGGAIDNQILISSNIGLKGEYHTALTILHEVVHGLTVQQITPHITQIGTTYQVNANAPTYVTKLVQLYNVARSVVGEDAIATIRTKVEAQKELNKQLNTATTEEERLAIRNKVADVALTPEEKRIQYGAFNINEFIAMSLTQPEFQREMAKHEYKNTGMNLMDKFKEVLNSILRAIGVNYSENSVTAQAINSIFELITDKNVNSLTPSTDKFNDMAEEGFGDANDEEFRNWLESVQWEGDQESLSVAELPSVPNINENNCY